jgi:type VI protein secretion system component VasK
LSSKKIGGNLWLLNFIPDNFLQLAVLAILSAGAVLYTVGLFINFIPPLYPYKEITRIIGTALIVAGVYFYGSYDTEMRWRKREEALQAQINQAEQKIKDANAKIKVKIVKQLQVIHDRQVVIKTEIQHDAAKIDAICKLDPTVVKDLNEAAKNPLRDSK